MPRGTKFISLYLVVIMSAGCVTKRVNLEDTGLPGSRTIIVGSIGADQKGLPVLGEPLRERPSRKQEHYTIVSLVSERPVQSYDIVVVGRNPNFHKPIEAVYEWTGKGFKLGVYVTGLLGQVLQSYHPSSLADAGIILAIVFAPIPIGTTGGFVVGVADGMVKTAEELGKTATKDERVITCTTYEYDSLDRLTLMRMYTANRSQELVRTTFEYEGSKMVPTRAVVKSIVEGTELDVH